MVKEKNKVQMRKRSSKEKRLCYVIMPFSKHVGINESEWTDVYETIFKPAVEGSGFGYRCERSSITTGSFTKEIVENMKNAHVVLADITGFNGNVMWELGVRHALSPRTIMVSRDNVSEKKVISDLGTYGVHFYENNGRSITQFKKEIKLVLKEFEKNPDKADSPVFEFFKSEELTLSSRDQRMQINKLTGLLNELIENLTIADNMQDGTYSVKTDSVSYYRFEFEAVTELLITNYIVMKDLKSLHNLKVWLISANIGLDALTDSIMLNKSSEIRKLKIEEIEADLKEIHIKLNNMIEKIKCMIHELKKGIWIEEGMPDIITYDEKYSKLIGTF